MPTAWFNVETKKEFETLGTIYSFSEFCRMAVKEEIQRRKEKRANEAGQ